MRNIIWCISPEYPIGYTNERFEDCINVHLSSDLKRQVLVWKPVSCGLTMANAMPPFALIPDGVPMSELIQTRPVGY